MDVARSLARVETADVVRDPFDHVFIRDFFDRSFFERLRASLPSVEDMTRYEAPHQFRYYYMLDRAGVAGLPRAIRPIWSDLASFFQGDEVVSAFHRKFAAAIRAQTRHRERLIDKVTEGGRVIETPRLMITSDCQNFLLKPHTDSGPKVVTVLFYLAEEGQPEDWGTEFYVPKDQNFNSFASHHFERDDFSLAKCAPFTPNALVAFVKTDRSFHGVDARGLEGGRRRNMVILNLELGRREDYDLAVGVDPAFFVTGSPVS